MPQIPPQKEAGNIRAQLAHPAADSLANQPDSKFPPGSKRPGAGEESGERDAGEMAGFSKKIIPPTGKIAGSSGKLILPSGEKANASEKLILPSGKLILPSEKLILPSGEIAEASGVRGMDAGVNPDGDEHLPEWYKPISHNYLRRAIWNDYHEPRIYMITLSKFPGQSAFSILRNDMLRLADPIYPVLTPAGMALVSGFKAVLSKYDALRMQRYVIMPDHIHFILSVDKHIDEHLGSVINRLKSNATRTHRANNRIPERERKPMFAEGFNDRILSNKDQLNNWHRYVMENPRRYLMRKSMPEYFAHTTIRLSNGESYFAYGNAFLARHPQMFMVKYSRKFSSREAEEWRRRCDLEIDRESVPVSAFIHPEEKRVMRKAFSLRRGVIQIEENPFGLKEKPEYRRFYQCTQGNLLIIALNKEKVKYDSQMTGQRAVALNKIAQKICDARKDNLLTR